MDRKTAFRIAALQQEVIEMPMTTAIASGHTATPSQAVALDADSSGLDVRLACRQGHFSGHTSGLASEYVQVNLVLLKKDQADDFLQFCRSNSVACPLLSVSSPGSCHLPGLGADLDVRTDAPRYHVWKSGQCVDEVLDLLALWRDDLVTFALGCSFSFEHALLKAGIPLRHVSQNRNVAMYRSNRSTLAAGAFSGPTVVSMRPLKASDVARAVDITSRMPMVHGAPIHVGAPEEIGIVDIARPDYGDPVEILADEVPVFWACGVTPQAAIAVAKPDFCITHAPGYMLVTDKRNQDLIVS